MDGLPASRSGSTSTVMAARVPRGIRGLRPRIPVLGEVQGDGEPRRDTAAQPP